MMNQLVLTFLAGGIKTKQNKKNPTYPHTKSKYLVSINYISNIKQHTGAKLQYLCAKGKDKEWLFKNILIVC